MIRKRRYEVSMLLSLLVPLLLPAGGARAADWEWTIAPYLWGSDTSLDLDVDDEPVIAADLSFSELLDVLEVAVPIHFEGRAGKAGFFVDALYLSLEDDTTTAANPPLPGGTMVHSEVDTGFYEAGGLYRFIDDRRVLDLLYGARVIDASQEHEVVVPSPINEMTRIESSDTLLDGFVGLRYGHAIGDRWDFLFRGDVGAGDTDLTWNFIGTFGVKLGKTDTYSMRFGWRHLDVEWEVSSSSGNMVESNLVLSGPAVMMVFKL